MTLKILGKIRDFPVLSHFPIILIYQTACSVIEHSLEYFPKFPRLDTLQPDETIKIKLNWTNNHAGTFIWPILIIWQWKKWVLRDPQFYVVEMGPLGLLPLSAMTTKKLWLILCSVMNCDQLISATISYKWNYWQCLGWDIIWCKKTE